MLRLLFVLKAHDFQHFSPFLFPSLFFTSSLLSSSLLFSPLLSVVFRCLCCVSSLCCYRLFSLFCVVAALLSLLPSMLVLLLLFLLLLLLLVLLLLLLLVGLACSLAVVSRFGAIFSVIQAIAE